MNAITTSTVPAIDGLLSKMASASGSEAGISQTSSNGANSSGEAPAAIVQLSEQAKALLQRDKTDRIAAQRLEAQVNSARPATKESRSSAQQKADNARADDIMRKYGDLPQAAKWAAQARMDNVELIKSGFGDAAKWIDFTRRMKSGEAVFLTPGRTPSDDEAFQISVNLNVARQIVTFEDAGQADKAQALRMALNTGTIRIQRTEEVPDLHLRYEVTHFGDAGGGGSMGSWDWKPTGDVKTAIDNGDAIAFGGGDRGAFYLTW